MDERSTADIVEDRNRWIRLFNKLEKHVSRHFDTKTAVGFNDDADDVLHEGWRQVLKETGSGEVLDPPARIEGTRTKALEAIVGNSVREQVEVTLRGGRMFVEAPGMDSLEVNAQELAGLLFGRPAWSPISTGQCANCDVLIADNQSAVRETLAWRLRVAELRAALEDAADDLGKAANQFAAMRESQRAGHMPEILTNPERFEEKEARARAALSASTEKGEPR